MTTNTPLGRLKTHGISHKLRSYLFQHLFQLLLQQKYVLPILDQAQRNKAVASRDQKWRSSLAVKGSCGKFTSGHFGLRHITAQLWLRNTAVCF